jgi:ABC-2 type transport system permease protein
MGSLRAELLILRKYPAYWVLLAITLAVTVLLGYVLPYVSYRSASAENRHPNDLADLLPGHVVASVLSALPFWFGMLALMLGVLMLGGEYGWGTLKSTLMQQPSRTRLLLAKLTAMGLALFLTLILVYLLAFACSVPIALIEGADKSAPPLWDVVRGLGAGCLILAAWAMLGAMLAVLSRETALATGVGIMYGLVLEGLISSFRQDIGLLDGLSRFFLRTNAYSLVRPLGATADQGGGPGGFSGPFVNAWQSLFVMVIYLAVFGAVTAVILRRRDVT